MISRDATVQDIFRIEPQPIQLSGDPRPFISKEMTPKHLHWLRARAMEEDGKILACYGLTAAFPGVADAWAVFSLQGLKYGKEITEDVLFWLERSVEEFGLRRVQAQAYEEHDAAHRWLERLGFEFEGKLKKFGMRGETCWMYGRT